MELAAIRGRATTAMNPRCSTACPAIVRISNPSGRHHFKKIKTSPAAPPIAHSQTVDPNRVRASSSAVHIGERISRIAPRTAVSTSGALTRPETHHPATPKINEAATNPNPTRKIN